MINILRVLYASFLKDALNYRTYKFNFLGELFLNFILVFILFYVAIVFRDSESEYLQSFNNNYFLFLLSGMMVLLFLTRTFSALPVFVSNSKTLGFFEKLISAKAPIYIILLGSVIFPAFLAVLRILSLFLFAYLFDPKSMEIIKIFEVLIVLIFSSIPFIGISMILCALIIKFQNANFLNSLFLLGCSIFSGIFYPIDVMPNYLQVLSYIFPSTFSVNIIRGRLLENLMLSELYADILLIIFLGTIYILIGIFSLNEALNYAKQNGTTSQF